MVKFMHEAGSRGSTGFCFDSIGEALGGPVSSHQEAPHAPAASVHLMRATTGAQCLRPPT